jgi:hypothetical protein
MVFEGAKIDFIFAVLIFLLVEKFASKKKGWSTYSFQYDFNTRA